MGAAARGAAPDGGEAAGGLRASETNTHYLHWGVSRLVKLGDTCVAPHRPTGWPARLSAGPGVSCVPGVAVTCRGGRLAAEGGDFAALPDGLRKAVIRKRFSQWNPSFVIQRNWMFQKRPSWLVKH